MINFITNIDYGAQSGGFSGMSTAAFNALREKKEVEYIGPINPPPILWQKVWSKILRTSNLGGDFFFFSEERLNLISELVKKKCSKTASLDFFNGFTPWCKVKNERPYVAWSDCTFHDYINIFHKKELFSCHDLLRIEEAECAWLNNASRVIFRSSWAAKRARIRYNIVPEKIGISGFYGLVKVPTSDTYFGKNQFLFVSTNFEAKGGLVVLSAFKLLKKKFHDATLVIAGHLPQNIELPEGARYVGFLRKEMPDEYEKFCALLSESRALVHPTRSDTHGLILVEAGYYGCPAISTRRFAIPEIIDHQLTGFLLDDPSDILSVLVAMEKIIVNEKDYKKMRIAVRRKTCDQYSKELFNRKIVDQVFQVLKY